MPRDTELASAGHKFGQIIGDWFEEYFAVPLLSDIADALSLYLDDRFKNRSCRGDKILWEDSEKNSVDYDFVLELDGSDTNLGIPVAFIESFWRRGARHSKDKSRDDSGKLLPMRSTYPTARVLGIIGAGEFTEPSREYVASRKVDLLYVPKDKIIAAWRGEGVEVDYPDRTSEAEKNRLVAIASQAIENDPLLKERVAARLMNLLGQQELRAYRARLAGKLGATPQQYKITMQLRSEAILFPSYQMVDDFLSKPEPNFDGIGGKRSYCLEVVFGDGDSFLGDSLSWDELKQRHNELKRLVQHMEML
jgi:hypothetical protein